MQSHQLILLTALPLLLPPMLNAAAAGLDAAEAEANLLLLDLDRKVALEQYHHLQMNAFEPK